MNREYSVLFMRGQGCFNTFIIFDLIDCPELYNNNFIKAAHQLLMQYGDDDALILLPAQTNDDKYVLTAHMVVLEPDGSFANFCGNGSRVIGAYFEQKYGSGVYAIVSPDKTREIIIQGNGLYSVTMGSTLFDPQQSEFVVNAVQNFITSDEKTWHTQFNELPHAMWYFTQTGEPHLVSCNQVSDDQLHALGILLNTHQYRHIFPKGINLNVVAKLNNKTITTRTFERGVNRITKACGTGSTSSAIFAYHLGYVDGPDILVKTLGGDMTITYNATQGESIMTGPAVLEAKKNKLVIAKPTIRKDIKLT